MPMSIKELASKIKLFITTREKDLFYIILLTTTAGLAFGLGRLAQIEAKRPPIRIEMPQTSTSTAGEPVTTINPAPASLGGLYVASKNGTKYHFPWCSGALRINEENKIWFDNKTDAEAAGYEPAANCKGL
jgi:hypothetical protein